MGIAMSDGRVALRELAKLGKRVEALEKQINLIAAAPDVKEALEECLKEWGGYQIKGECERKARAALAKAEGQP